MIFSAGCLVHADTPARASDALISLRNSRRPLGSFHCEACSGNSRCRYSRNCAVSASSPRLRQNRRPSDPAKRDRMAEKSITSSLPVTGGTARQLVRAGDLVLLHQPLAEAGIVRRPHVRHVEHLVFWPHVLRRIAMAIEAPPHL